MGKLYLDDFVIKKGFKSTEEYIQNCLDEQRIPQFKSVKYYQSLWSHGLIKEGFSIRTSDAGIIDRHYWVNAEGNLVGATEGPYPGEAGTFKPDEILSGQRISNGWTIESTSGLSYLFRRWTEERK